MTTRRIRVAVFGVFVLGTAASEACRAPTQAELDISTSAQCSEIGSVALVVSNDPTTAEARVGQGFYAAQTTDCDVNHWIGSLFVTPGDDHAAVIVIAPPAGTPINDCQPPKYAGCIVARRAFSFIDHVSLKIPIALDVECRDVPCDAFSTCRKGSCYASSTVCDDTGTCLGEGELPDGGLSPDAEVLVDGSPPHDDDGASVEASTPDADAGDAGDGGDVADSGDADADDGDSGAPAGVFCDAAQTLHCGGAGLCTTGQACCSTPPALVCGNSAVVACGLAAVRYCCTSAQCGGGAIMSSTGTVCHRTGLGPGTCGGSFR